MADLKSIRPRTFLNRDFNSFRADLLEYARVHFQDKVQDFSDPSVGALFTDLAAYIGDNLSYYLDYQFGELDPETVIETKNFVKLLKRSGIKDIAATPATAKLYISIEIPATTSGGVEVPDPSAIPVISAGSTFNAVGGITFELLDDLDYRKTKNGSYIASIEVAESTAGIPTLFKMTLVGNAVSGNRAIDTFEIPNSYVKFRTVTLSNTDITQIVGVTDSSFDEYYEVDSLTHDTVFKRETNVTVDNVLVPDLMRIQAAPRRFVRETDFTTLLTSLRFGAGSTTTLDDNIVPDPSEFAVPLYGKTTFTRFTVDPGNMLRTRTLGISPQDTALSVIYRYGGGLQHNVAQDSINSVGDLSITFPGLPSVSTLIDVRNSVGVTNPKPARGGEDTPAEEELKRQILAARNAQARIVTREDLLARLHTMPSNFGRIYRAGIVHDSTTPLSTQLYVLSRDIDDALVIAPDSLKENIRVYLDQFRLISDAIDILDAPIVNVGVEFKIKISSQAENRAAVVEDAILAIQEQLDIGNLQINQPIVLDDLQQAIFELSDVISVVDIRLVNHSNTSQGRTYSDVIFDIGTNTRDKVVVPPPGGIFEVKYPDLDIIGSAV